MSISLSVPHAVYYGSMAYVDDPAKAGQWRGIPLAQVEARLGITSRKPAAKRGNQESVKALVNPWNEGGES